MWLTCQIASSGSVCQLLSGLFCDTMYFLSLILISQEKMLSCCPALVQEVVKAEMVRNPDLGLPNIISEGRPSNNTMPQNFYWKAWRRREGRGEEKGRTEKKQSEEN